jgi:hypothetical protein
MRNLTVLFTAAAIALILAVPASAGPATVAPLVQASGPSPFAACTVGGPGTLYTNAEVEPFVAVNPANPSNVIGVFQQDRWSNGGAHGLVTEASLDGGATWTTSFPHFSTCAGGTAANGGDYDRSSDPWVSIGPDGRAYQISLSVNSAQTVSAVLASTSTDGGLTWSEPATIKRDDSPITSSSTTRSRSQPIPTRPAPPTRSGTAAGSRATAQTSTPGTRSPSAAIPTSR